MKKFPFNNCQKLLARLSSISSQESKRNFHFFLCVERQPVITRPLIKIEKKFKETLADLEYTHSLKCDFELAQEKENKMRAKLNTDELSEQDLEDFKNTIQDIEEKFQANLKNLKVAPREDKKVDENHCSTKRLLHDSLFLVKKQKDESGKDVWLPPKDVVNQGESIKDAIRRLTEQCCGKDSVTNLYSYVPMGFVQEKGEDAQKDSQNVFYFLVKYLKGPQSFSAEYQWLSSQELKKSLPAPIYKNMQHLFVTSK